MSFLMIAINLVRALIQHPATSQVARYAVRQGTAAVVREIRRQTVKKRTQRIS